MGPLVTEELLTFRGPFLPFLPPCDIIRLFKMIECIKYQTCWKYSKYSCHIVTSYMCSRWTIDSHYVLLCNISLMSGSSWATSYIMSNCRRRNKRKQLSLSSSLRLNTSDDTEKQSTLFPFLTWWKTNWCWKWELRTFLCKQIMRQSWPLLTSIFSNQRSTSCSVLSKKRWEGQWWRDSWNQMINILFCWF